MVQLSMTFATEDRLSVPIKVLARVNKCSLANHPAPRAHGKRDVWLSAQVLFWAKNLMVFFIVSGAVIDL